MPVRHKKHSKTSKRGGNRRSRKSFRGTSKRSLKVGGMWGSTFLNKKNRDREGGWKVPPPEIEEMFLKPHEIKEVDRNLKEKTGAAKTTLQRLSDNFRNREIQLNDFHIMHPLSGMSRGPDTYGEYGIVDSKVTDLVRQKELELRNIVYKINRALGTVRY